MEKFVKGDIVIVPFPFSDLSESKKRPAMVIAELKGDDVILCDEKIYAQTMPLRNTTNFEHIHF